MNWFYRLFVYECKACAVWREHTDSLERQLESVKRERDILLTHVIGPKQSEPIETPEEFTPVKRFVPFRIKQQLAEAESRAQAKILLEKEREIREANEKLAKDLGIGDDDVISENAG